jgi:hypothetical protein
MLFYQHRTFGMRCRISISRTVTDFVLAAKSSDFLIQIFTKRKATERDVIEYKAEWEKMVPCQPDRPTHQDYIFLLVSLRTP